MLSPLHCRTKISDQPEIIAALFMSVVLARMVGIVWLFGSAVAPTTFVSVWILLSLGSE